jgi:hypothetical protein
VAAGGPATAVSIGAADGGAVPVAAIPVVGKLRGGGYSICSCCATVVEAGGPPLLLSLLLVLLVGAVQLLPSDATTWAGGKEDGGGNCLCSCSIADEPLLLLPLPLEPVVGGKTGGGYCCTSVEGATVGATVGAAAATCAGSDSCLLPRGGSGRAY